LAGHEIVSCAGAAATIFTDTLTWMTDVPLCTLNNAEYVPAASDEVLNVTVSVPVFVPLVGDTVSQLAVGAVTVQRSAFLVDTCTALVAMLVPTVP